jgi:hypothetical protein
MQNLQNIQAAIVAYDREITNILHSDSQRRADLLMELYRLSSEPESIYAALVARLLLAHHAQKGLS